MKPIQKFSESINQMQKAWEEQNIHLFMNAHKEAAISFSNHLQEVIDSKNVRLIYDLETNKLEKKVKRLGKLIATADARYDELLHKLNAIEVMEQRLEFMKHESTH